ncbi:hypothetical protein [Nocardia gamkensis]|uniref:hypothetical protein n=1 Tax=Nocardia gamkensis TaxID=352869 RepID=UPI0037C5AD3A
MPPACKQANDPTSIRFGPNCCPQRGQVAGHLAAVLRAPRPRTRPISRTTDQRTLPPLDITITTNHGGDRIAWARNHAFRALASE